MAEQHEQQGAPQGQQQTSGAVGDRVRDFAAGAADKAKNLAQTARDQAEAGASAVSSGMRNLADALRQNVPEEGMMGTAASSVADTLERGGRYLEQEGIGALVEDLGTLVRRNPLPAVLVSIGVGFVFAQMFRSER